MLSSDSFLTFGQNQTSLFFFCVLSELQSFQFLYAFFILVLCENFATVDDSRFLAVPLRRSLRFGSSTVSVKSSRSNKFQQETHVKCYYAFLYQQQHQGKGNDEGSSSY